MRDDHYIPNPKNAHIDTSEIERAYIKRMKSEGYENYTEGEPKLGETHPLERRRWAHEWLRQQMFYELQQDPAQPDEYAVVARLLSPEKFLWFCNDWAIHFSSPSAFDDYREGTLPEDLDAAAYRILNGVGVPGDGFDEVVRTEMNTYSVSCWTHIDEHHDDHLLWHKYAGGETGVGITVRYGLLRECLGFDLDREAGLVDYTGAFVRPLFSKRPIFRNEKEVRFVKPTRELAVSIRAIRDEIRLRFSPDAPNHHKEAVERIWQSVGGKI